MSQDRTVPPTSHLPPTPFSSHIRPAPVFGPRLAAPPARMAVLRQLALLLWKNYSLQVGPALWVLRGGGARGLVEGHRWEGLRGPPPPAEGVVRGLVEGHRWKGLWCPLTPRSRLPPEAEGAGDPLGALSAPAVLWDPDLAPPEDPVRERAQCHPLPQPVHPRAAPLLQLPSPGGHLGAGLHPIPK